MRESKNTIFHGMKILVLTFILLVFGSASIHAEEYDALNGLKSLHTVFDFSQGSPQIATVVFPAIRGVYQDESVTSLPNPPRTVIVFRGAAVKLISTDRQGDAKDQQALDQVAEMIRQFKKEGVKMEVCMYAVQVMGVDPETILPEIDKVGNGFISVSGYEAQGYSVITIL